MDYLEKQQLFESIWKIDNQLLGQKSQSILRLHCCNSLIDQFYFFSCKLS